MSPVPSSVTACRGIPPPVRSASAPNCYRQRGGGGPRRPSREAAAVGIGSVSAPCAAPSLTWARRCRGGRHRRRRHPGRRTPRRQEHAADGGGAIALSQGDLDAAHRAALDGLDTVTGSESQPGMATTVTLADLGLRIEADRAQLSHVALHGLEAAAGVRYRKVGVNAAETVEGAPVLVRYADDLVALCHSRDQALQVKERLAAWLAPRGLAFNEAKTRIVTIDAGFDFLAFNVRRYDGKLLIKPSKAAQRRVRERLRAEMRALRGANALAVIRTINPIVRGWVAYYRTVVSSEAFDALDDYLWKLTYKWATWGHQNKPKRWVIDRYFGQFNPARRTRWVFGDRETGAYLTKFAWTSIVRHQMVSGTSSPDDPALTSYWATRRRKGPPLPMGQPDLRLLQAQHGRCPLCGDLLLHADHQPQSPHEWEQWLKVTRKALARHHLAADREPGMPDVLKPRLVHAYCQRRHLAAGRPPALRLHVSDPIELA